MRRREALPLKWLRVFRCAVATRRGLGVRQVRQTSVVRSEKCVACRGSTQDGMRLIPACFAHVLQRWIRRVYMRFLLILQEVRAIGKTRNQLLAIVSVRILCVPQLD